MVNGNNIGVGARAGFGRPVTRELMRSVVVARGIPKGSSQRAWYDSMLDNAGIPADFLQDVQNILAEYQNQGGRGWRALLPGEPNAQAALAQVVGTDMARHIIQNVNAYAEANEFLPYGTGGALSEESGLFFSNSANSSRLRQEDWYGDLLTTDAGKDKNWTAFLGGERDVVGGFETGATSGDDYGDRGVREEGGEVGGISGQSRLIDESGTAQGRENIFRRYLAANYSGVTPLARTELVRRFEPLESQYALQQALDPRGVGMLGAETPQGEPSRATFRDFLSGLNVPGRPQSIPFGTQQQWLDPMQQTQGWFGQGDNITDAENWGKQIVQDPTIARNIITQAAIAGLNPMMRRVAPGAIGQDIDRFLEKDPTGDIWQQFVAGPGGFRYQI